MAYETHHLSLEELWYVREHPFNVKVVAVKRLVSELDAAEAEVAKLRKRLDGAVAEMNERRETTAHEATEEPPATKAIRRRVARGFE